jgi:hypothetical protein
VKCHSCPHSDAILRGDYNSKPWNELPCATCKLGEDTFYSVPFDEENPPVPVAGCPDHILPQAYGLKPKASGSDMLPAATLASFIQGILSLPSELRDIVAWRYQGVPYKEIARRQGTSIQLAEMRHKRALREWPVLQSLFPYKTAKRLRRLSRK